MHHIHQLALINLQSASACSLKDKELEEKFLLLFLTVVCDCGSISTNFKTAALRLFSRNVFQKSAVFEKGVVPHSAPTGTWEMLHRGYRWGDGPEQLVEGWKTLLKGTQLVTGAFFPPFLHQEKFNPMMLEAIDILF